MAAPGDFGTYFYGFDTGSVSGRVNREDLLDLITNIDPWDAPFVSQAPKVRARHVVHEWLKDTLPATSTAGAIEGDDFSSSTSTQPIRVLNVTQIFRQDVTVTETQRAVNPAGFRDAYAFQVQKHTKANARNIEATLFSAAASASGASGSGRVLRTFQDSNFLVTATSASLPCINVRSLGTATTANADLTEFDFNELLELVYTNGGSPEMAFVSPATKRVISGFTTRAGFFAGSSSSTLGTNQRNIAAMDKRVVASVDVYDSDYGLIQIVLDRWVPQAADGSTTDYAGVAFFFQRNMNRLAWLRPMQNVILGKSGDNIRGIVVGELTLEVLNECANGYIRGIRNPSA